MRVPVLLCALLVALPAAAGEPLSVEAGETGRAPRALRLSPREGDAWDVQIRRRVTLRSAVDDAPAEELPAPEATHVLSAEVRGGEAVLALVDSDLASANVAARATLADQLEEIASARVVFPLDPLQRGSPEVRYLPETFGEFAAEVLGDVGWALTTTAIPLPETGVGVGGTWTWSREAVEQGVPVTQRFRARLLERRGTRLRVELVVDVGTGDAPVLLEDATVTLSSRVNGTVWLDLRRPLARAADLALGGELRGQWEEEGTPRHLVTTFEGALIVVTRDRRP